MTMLPGMSKDIWFDGEQFKNAVWYEHCGRYVTLPNHYFSKSGRFASTDSGQFILRNPNQTDMTLGSRYLNDLNRVTGEYETRGTRGPKGSGKFYKKSIAYPILVPQKLLKFPHYMPLHEREKPEPRVQITIRGHKGMMDTWKPIEKNPPKELADDWDDAPESFKKWVRATANVDHTKKLPDGRGDTSCNHIDFLEWSKPNDNNFWVKKAIEEGRYDPDEIDLT